MKPKIKMKLQSVVLVFFLLFISCEWDSAQPVEDEWINVAYVSPVYQEASSLVNQVTVEAPRAQTSLGKMIIYQNYVFINEPMEGVHIVDNSNPSNPTQISFLSIPGNLDLSIIDDHLYVDMFSSLAVFDISDITNPKFKKDYTIENVFDYDSLWNFPVELWDDVDTFVEFRKYPDINEGIVVDWEIETILEKRSIDSRYYTLENTSNGIAFDSEDGGVVPQISTAGSMTRFLPIDKYLYTINANELTLFQIDSDNQPRPWIKKNTETQAETLFQLNDMLFVGAVNGMLIYDVSDASDPEYINRIEHMRSCDPVVADADYAYVTLRGGTNCFTAINELQVIDIQDPMNLSVVARKDMFNPHGPGVHSNHLIVCDGAAGIKVVDIHDADDPKIVNHLPIQFAYDVIIDYPRALVVGAQELFQYDISALPELRLESQTPILD